MKAWMPVLLTIPLYLFMPSVPHAENVSACSISTAQEKQSWDHDCAAAIEIEHDPVKKAELHFRRAYVLNEHEAYQESLNDLNAACAMVPHHAAYLHERAYTLNSLGRYREALVDLNEQARLEPQAPGVYEERALTRTRLGDWEGALDDRDREAKLRPDSKSALIARAQARLWVGQFDEARQDLNLAAALTTNPTSNEDAEYFKRVSILI